MVHSKLIPSKSQARKLIDQKGVRLNGKLVTAHDAIIELGELKVGKLKVFSLGHYLKLHIMCSSGGTASVDLSPLFQSKKIEAIADALRSTAFFMERKAYLKIPVQLSDERILSDHFKKLLLSGLMNYVERENGIIEIDVYMDEYMKDLDEIIKYVKYRDIAVELIKNQKKKDGITWNLECPKCKKSTLNGAYNIILGGNPEEKYNVNGSCQNYSCSFKFNELA